MLSVPRSRHSWYGPLLEATTRTEYRPALSQERPEHPGWYDRESRIKDYPDTFTTEQRQFCMTYWHHQCCLCGSTDNMQMDHWIPVLSKAFPGTTATNMLPMCKHCNTAKHCREPRRWVRETTLVSP